jgi:20S proteasome alpha/beta subunit
MTVLVGIRCKDGVVVGSDSSVTFGAMGGRTIEQAARKVEVIEDCMIVAGTGQVGLGQRFCHQLTQSYLQKKFSGANHIDMGKAMSKLAIEDFASTHANKGQYGALVAFAAKHEPHLCEFAVDDFQPEIKTEHIWYASMGSGQAIADPFLGLMRKVFWKNGMPTLTDGVFAAAWTLQHTIDVNPGGVNGPIHLATLCIDGGKAVAKYLTEEEIGQHLENVRGAEKYLHGYSEVLQGTTGVTPDVPLPASAK